MSAIKHTPGPWIVGSSHPGGAARPRLPEPCYLVASEDGVIVQTETQEKRDRANAQLIAAAPDLLEAAKCVVAAFDEDEAKHAMHLLHGAIDKAEGRRS